MSNNFDDAFSSALGVMPPDDPKPNTDIEIITPTSTQIIEPEFAGEEAQDQIEDYMLARNTFRNLIRQGSTAIDDMKELAGQTESPRAYEVFATLMKTVSETTKDLFELQKKNKELKMIGKQNAAPESSITVEKAVFVGTTKDLLTKIKAEENNGES